MITQFDINRQIDLESIDDKSKVVLFVKHPAKIRIKELLKKNYIIIVKNALRKVIINFALILINYA